MSRMPLTLFSGVAFVLLSSSTMAMTILDDVYWIHANKCSGPSSSPGRVLTGFAQHGLVGIITALHGVVGCEEIFATPPESVPFEVEIKKVDTIRDVALLIPISSPSKIGMGIRLSNNKRPRALAKISIVGYPFNAQLQRENQGKLRNSPLELLLEGYPEHKRRDLENRNSPSPRIEVLSLDIELAPGFSGAPILLEDGTVIGVANSMLPAGSIGWAIPISKITWSDASKKGAELKRLGQLDLPYSVSLGLTDHALYMTRSREDCLYGNAARCLDHQRTILVTCGNISPGGGGIMHDKLTCLRSAQCYKNLSIAIEQLRVACGNSFTSNPKNSTPQCIQGSYLRRSTRNTCLKFEQDFPTRKF